MNHSKKIVFLFPYPVGEAPSQRFRFEQYLTLLKDKSIKITLLSFFNQSAWRILYRKNNSLYKSFLLTSSFIKRVNDVFATLSADVVFIHREVLPLGPPVLEWIIAKLFRKKIVYDFDDAIWLTDKTSESYIQKTLRWRSKVALICQWSYKVSCGNEYLMKYASQFNNNAVLNPTTIDTEGVHNFNQYPKPKENDEIIIGWTGSHSTLKYLYLLEDVLQQIQIKFKNVQLLVISDQPPQMNIERLIFKPWNKESEIKDLLLTDIGIMPLPDDEWAKGKCGFKALQYMALEIPSVASPVGVNAKIITHGINGYLCSTTTEWISVIKNLITDTALRKRIGIAGRSTVINHYSVSSNAFNFLSLFD